MSRTTLPPQRRKRCPLMNTLSAAQKRRIESMIRIYRCDLDDPAAVEALTVILELCRILDLLPHEVETLFTSRLLAALEHWDGQIVSAPGHSPRPPQLRRAWVWLPNQPGPHLVAVADDGVACLYADAIQRKARKKR